MRSGCITYVLAVALAGVAGCSGGGRGEAGVTAAASGAERPPLSLSGGAPSIDTLLDEFLAALEQRDAEALHRLRLSQTEYTEIIVPGEAPKGQAPRQTYEQVNDVFWGMLDAKSRYSADALMNDFGGRHYIERRLALTHRAPREWAWYTGHGEVRLMLKEADGPPRELRTGWIAEVDGRFKFIGFNWDD